MLGEFTSATKIEITLVSKDYTCAIAPDYNHPAVYPVSGKPEKLRTWLNHHTFFIGVIEGYGELMERIMCPVQTRFGVLIMDAITGSFYNREDGRCYSSERLVLKIVKHVGDQASLARMMKVRACQND